MSLTFTELGISEADWNMLASSKSQAHYQVDLYQWTPDWQVGGGVVTDFPDFDAINVGDEIWQVNYFQLTNLSVVDPDYTPPATAVIGIPPSIATDGTNTHVFAVTDSGIELNKFNGSIWFDYSVILSDVTVKFIAAVTPDRVHYLTYDSTAHLYQFHVLKLVGGVTWTDFPSDIYWGYSINSFAAKLINGVDVLVLASDSPGIQSVSVIGTEISKKLLPSGGLYTFTYKYDAWSDHIEVDHIDQWSSFRYRNQVRLSVIDSTLYMTCYSSDGTKDNPITGYRVYTSKDGIHWSRGELLKIPDDVSSKGILLLAHGTTVYAMTYDLYYTSKRTLLFGGTPHADTTLSLTGRVKQMSVSRQDMQQIQIEVDNARSFFANTFVDGSHTIAAILKTGYQDILIQGGVFEMDTLVPMRELPVNSLQLVGRDHLSWLTSKSQSEQFLNWIPQIIGLDEYVDSTGTGYGGMTHSAPAIGSFKAADGALQLSSNNEEGQALNTWLSDNWNGSVESRTTLATLGNDEYIGLIFRSPDKDNGFFYYYDQTSDSLKLDIRLAGAVTNLWTQASMGWSGALDSHWLRVTYRYSKIILYSSSDGLTWTEEDQVIVDGQVSDAAPLLQSGYVGSFGRGFSDLSESYPELGAFPEGVLPDNYTSYDNPTPDTPTDPTPPTPVYWEYDHSWANNAGQDSFSAVNGHYDHIYGYISNLNPSSGIEVRRTTFAAPFLIHELALASVYWTTTVGAVHIHMVLYRSGSSVATYDVNSTLTGNQRSETFDFTAIDVEIDEIRLIALQGVFDGGSGVFSEAQFKSYTIRGTGFNPFI